MILNFGTSLFNLSLVWRLLVVYSQICMVLIVCGWSAVQSRLLAMTGANYYGIWTARSSLARSFVWLAKVKPALFSGLMSGMADDECDGGTETLIRPKVSDNFCLRPFSHKLLNGFDHKNCSTKFVNLQSKQKFQFETENDFIHFVKQKCRRQVLFHGPKLGSDRKKKEKKRF